MAKGFWVSFPFPLIFLFFWAAIDRVFPTGGLAKIRDDRLGVETCDQDRSEDRTFHGSRVCLPTFPWSEIFWCVRPSARPSCLWIEIWIAS